MLGAIIGDIAGSRFEFNNHRSKEFELLTDECRATDDSIMTLAVAKAIMETSKLKQPSLRRCAFDGEDCWILKSMTVKSMQEIGRRYPNCGYGGMFSRWVFSDTPAPYNSYGNGAAMRISPAGFAAKTEDEARILSRNVTEVTHNHEEGIRGAEATAMAVFMARSGATKQEIRDRVEKDYYKLDFTLDGIRDTYRFDVTCQGTVPQAIVAFLESVSFEDAIRNAVSIGGDSDTLAAITGAIAEAYYGVPDVLRTKALTYLDEELRAIVSAWEAFVGGSSKERFEGLTKYIGKLAGAASCGEWIVDTENDGSPEHPIQMPYVDYSKSAVSFIDEFYRFSDSHPEYELTHYESILESNGLKWDCEQMRGADTENIEAHGILALIMGVIRADRFCEGTLYAFFNDGTILEWLKRLKAIDSDASRGYDILPEEN
jgi:ADP-ribosylglycohydrolase